MPKVDIDVYNSPVASNEFNGTFAGILKIEKYRAACGNRIVACNPYHRLIYILSIFNVPTNVPADLLDAIGLLYT